MGSADQLIDRTVIAANIIAAGLAVFATLQPERRDATMAGEDGKFQLLERADRALRAIAGMLLIAPAGIRPDMKILEHDRETALQNFRIGEA